MRRSSMALILLLLVSCSSGFKEQADFPDLPFRGVWLTNVDSHVLDSRESISHAMEQLSQMGFNTVFPVVWNKAWTIYPSDLMAREFGRRIDPAYGDFDPLAAVVEEAHARNIRVIPWFEFGLAASYNQDGGFLIGQRPEWAAKDAEGNLLEKNNFEWMNAFHPEVQDFILGLILEVVTGYDVDGIQGDDRLPALPSHGGYSDFSRALYLEETGKSVPDNWDDPDFMTWKSNKLSSYAKRIYDSVKAVSPDILVTWSPSVYPWSYDNYLQDWPTWIKNGYADLVIPQVYRYSFDEYRKTLMDMSPSKLGLDPAEYRVIPGVLINLGNYLIPEPYLQKVLELNRSCGFSGEVLFFYEGLNWEDGRVGRQISAFYSGNP